MKVLSVVVAVLSLGLAQSAVAQTVMNPTAAEIGPSPDHFATLPDGTSAVTGYTVQFYLIGAASPFQVANVGKPPLALCTDGTQCVKVSQTASGSPLFSLPTGQRYEATASATGPGGESALTARSNPFDLIGAPRPPTGIRIIKS